MFNLDNITVKQFFHLKDENLAQQYLQFTLPGNPFYLKPRGVFAKKEATPLGQLTFGQVANIKHNLSKPSFENIFECFEFVFNVKLETYLRQDVISYFYALNWITSNLKQLVERESKSLGGDPDDLLDMAGVKRLAAFGELNTLKSIAQQFGKSPEEVENWKYNLVFSLMLHDKVSGEVQTAYNQLKYGSKSKT
ncbi:hypothetical protein SAMN06296241_1372 [Salinimicrobium sediminis]|uniref:Uncharacterized protein n=1 Tax=Salinimicrobium sediminis TaxID=1343891 RepID=A0A285X3E8_9FLAO|nr:hypothetical protein [Salinimicrobium sediminis]SOC79835.1 hypothetical protein SAMN06296241_1372 [Salinimicrobium sediminis]